jgi:hypothetical protein
MRFASSPHPTALGFLRRLANKRLLDQSDPGTVPAAGTVFFRERALYPRAQGRRSVPGDIAARGQRSERRKAGIRGAHGGDMRAILGRL